MTTQVTNFVLRNELSNQGIRHMGNALLLSHEEKGDRGAAKTSGETEKKAHAKMRKRGGPGAGN